MATTETDENVYCNTDVMVQLPQMFSCVPV